jgi:Zn-dependent protease
MFNNSYQIGRIFGIPIKLDVSLIILAVLLSFRTGNIFDGLTLGLLLMLSVGLHELGHTYAALKFGCRVRDITLMLIGGRATLLDMPNKPWKEFVLAASGPAVSATLWIGGHFLGLSLARFNALVGLLFIVLSTINKYLFLFNLLPAFPMDGGRMLRALLQHNFMTHLRATWVASRIGRFIAILMAV